MLITSSSDGSIRFRDAATLDPVGVIAHQPDWVEALSISPDGTRLAAGRFNGTLSLFDVKSFKEVLGPWVAFEIRDTGHGTGTRHGQAAEQNLSAGPVIEFVDSKAIEELRDSRHDLEAESESRIPCPQARSSMRSKALFALILLSLGVAFAAPLRADERVIPPAITKIWPVGMQRGTTATFTLDGRNLSDIKAVIFDSPGISAKVMQITDVPEKKPTAARGLSIPTPRYRTAKSKPPPSKSPPPKRLRRASTGSAFGRRWEPQT